MKVIIAIFVLGLLIMMVLSGRAEDNPTWEEERRIVDDWNRACEVRPNDPRC